MAAHMDKEARTAKRLERVAERIEAQRDRLGTGSNKSVQLA
jgi:hypothetical protein